MRVLGQDLGYNTLSDWELDGVLSGRYKINFRGEVPGFAAFYGALVMPDDDKLQRVIHYEQVVIINEKLNLRIGRK